MMFEESQFYKVKEKLKKVLDYSKNTKYYNHLYNDIELNIDDIKSYDDFKQIPILTKKMYETNKFNIITNESNIDTSFYESLQFDFKQKKSYLWEKGLYVKVTSGSTGKPIEIIKAQADIKREYVGLNLYRKIISGAIPQGNFVWIWPVNSYTKKYFYDNNNSFYRVNSYGWQYMFDEYSFDSFNKVYAFIKYYNISWITASPSFLYDFSSYIKVKNLKCKFSYIECHSELLHQWQVELIQDILGSQPVSVYSSNEIQFMGVTCECGKMHLISQNVFLELLQNEIGRKRIIATSLCNYKSPIIRYDLGDEAEWDSEPCGCGLKSPKIKLTGFRDNDFLLCADNRKFEPFVVTDSIIFLRTKYHLNINAYFVYQSQYNELHYYFEDYIFQDLCINTIIVEFLKNYFYEITHLIFKILLFSYNNVHKVLNTKKFKYFMVGESIEKQ